MMQLWELKQKNVSLLFETRRIRRRRENAMPESGEFVSREWRMGRMERKRDRERQRREKGKDEDGERKKEKRA